MCLVATQAEMLIPAGGPLAPAVIKVSAHLGQGQMLCWTGLCWRVLGITEGHWCVADWVGRAVTGHMVISQAIGATRNDSCPALNASL